MRTCGSYLIAAPKNHNSLPSFSSGRSAQRCTEDGIDKTFLANQYTLIMGKWTNSLPLLSLRQCFQAAEDKLRSAGYDLPVFTELIAMPGARKKLGARVSSKSIHKQMYGDELVGPELDAYVDATESIIAKCLNRIEAWQFRREAMSCYQRIWDEQDAALAERAARSLRRRGQGLLQRLAKNKLLAIA